MIRINNDQYLSRFYLFRYTATEDNYPDLIVGSTAKQPLLETPGEVHRGLAFLCEYHLLFHPSESSLSTAFVHLIVRKSLLYFWAVVVVGWLFCCCLYYAHQEA
jgi:hypothetical protein